MASQRPNILCIITDHVAYYGHDREGEFEYKPPRFEEFASQGVRFNRAYSVSPVCTPARSSIMTGQYSHNHGLTINTEYGGATDFRQGQQLYSHYLSKSGYRNGYIGKWHCGHYRLPIDYGIEGWSMPDYGKVYQSNAYKQYCEAKGLDSPLAHMDYNRQHPEWNGQTFKLDEPGPFNYYMRGCGVLEGPPACHEEQFVAHMANEKLREFANCGQPWSLVASFWGPHHPYFPSEPYASMVAPESIPEYPTYRDKLESKPLRYLLHRDMTFENPSTWPDWSIWQKVLARAYGQGYQTDAAVGEILDTVDELGLRENTIIIWCADHGDTVASHGGVWDKAATYSEEVGRIPFAVRWPNQVMAGATTENLISNMDITATMLDVAGVEVPPSMDSRSILPVCLDPENATWPEQLFCEHYGHTVDKIVQRIVIQGNYKYVAALYDSDEFYDLQADPFETNNLINSKAHEAVKTELRKSLIAHIEQSDDAQGLKIAYKLKQGR